MPATKLTLDWQGRPIELEIKWVGSAAVLADKDAPVMVFLHEGLGSVALWKDFPDALCRRLGMRGLLYSRPGYGNSTPRASDERWGVDFMHRQANEVLPALLDALGIARPWLFGHSDGGSIALLFAAHHQARTAGVIALAPHIMVESMTIASIRQARFAFLQQGLRVQLARYHRDVDSAFFGWNNIWLAPEFFSWTIESDLHRIAAPVLAIQGENDEYGSMRQVLGIQEKLASTKVVALPACGHSPHRDQPQQLTDIVAKFVARQA